MSRLTDLLRRRQAPPPTRRPVASSPSGPAPQAWPADDGAEAFDLARRAAEAGDEEPALALARRALQGAVRTPALAARVQELLGAVARPTDAALAARARAAWHAGELTSARADALASSATRDIATTRALLRSIEGELRALTPGWLPPIPRGSGSVRSTARPRRPGRVLHLVSTSRPHTEGGFAIRTHEVARAQLGAGLDVQVATPPGFPGPAIATPAFEELDGVPYHRLLPAADKGLPADERLVQSAAALLDLALRLEPAAIQSAETAGISETTAQAALAVGRHLGIPVVLEVRGFREEAWVSRRAGGQPERYLRTRASDGATWAAADAVVTLGEAMRAEIVARGVPVERVRVIPNAVDIDRFAPGPRDAALAAELGILPGEVVIGYAGSLTWYEDLPALVRATRTLIGRDRPVRLLIVGDGAATESIREAAADVGLGDGLVLTGRVPYDRVVDYERLIDIFVVARTDLRLTRLVTPIKPIEALAVGSTLVVTDLPALAELVEDGRTGRTVRPGDDTSLAEVLDALVTDADERGRLAEAGLAWVRAERTWAANGLRYRALFEELGAV